MVAERLNRLNREVVRVPDVSGFAIEKARLVVENAGLRVGDVLFRESYETVNTVLEQEPARGQMIYEGELVTLWIARRSYMELLPAIYRRSDAVGRNVVRDICFLFEHMFSSIEDKLDVGHSYYDPHECDDGFLHWLASWTAMVLDVDWPLAKKRAILKRGVDLYRLRGTRRGLTLFLTLFTGHEPTIEENEWPFKGFRINTDARIAIDSVVLPPVDLAHCFTVTMPVAFESVPPEMVIRIHHIIAREKPAHCHYYLRFADQDDDVHLREFFSIGLRSGIGIGHEVIDDADAADIGAMVEVAEVKEPTTSQKPVAVVKPKVARKPKTSAPTKPSAKKKKKTAPTKTTAKKSPKPTTRTQTSDDDDPKSEA